jgi:hypothetical protein
MGFWAAQLAAESTPGALAQTLEKAEPSPPTNQAMLQSLLFFSYHHVRRLDDRI